MAQSKTSPPVPLAKTENKDKRIENPYISQEELEFIELFVSKKVQALENNDDTALELIHLIAKVACSGFLDVASKHPERVAKIVQRHDALPCLFSASPKVIDKLKEIHDTLRVGKKSSKAVKPGVANSRIDLPWQQYLIQAVEKIQTLRILRASFLIDPDAVGGCRNEVVARKWIGLPPLKSETTEEWFVEVWNMILDESNDKPQNHFLLEGKVPRETVKAGTKSQASTFKDDLKRIFVRMVKSKKA